MNSIAIYENPSFCFLFPSPPIGFFPLFISFFPSLFYLFFCFFCPTTLFFLCLHVLFFIFSSPSHLKKLSLVFNPPFCFVSLFLSVSPFIFTHLLLFPTPYFLAHFFHLLLNLANIFPLFLLPFFFFFSIIFFPFFPLPLFFITISCPSPHAFLGN